MGLLDKLLGNQPEMGPAWTQFLETQGLKPGQDVGPQRVTELLREYSQRQQASSQAPGVAKVLGERFGGVQADQYAPTASGDLVPSHYQTGDPEAASMVGLMANPATRGEGVAGALGMLAPQSAEQRARLSQDAQQFERTYAQAGTQFQQRMAQDAQQFGQSYALDQQRTRNQALNLDMDSASKIAAQMLQRQQYGFTNEASMRDDYNKNPLIVKAQLGLTSYQQLLGALKLNNATALTAAVVAMAQIQEPGLAVRADDRVAYNGTNPIFVQLKDSLNQMMDQGVTPERKARLMALGTQMAASHAANYFRVKAQWQQTAADTEGVDPARVTIGSGVDEGTAQQLLQLTGQQ